MHESPIPFVYQGDGKMITFKTNDGKEGSAFELKALKPSNKFIFVIHEWWGLNDYIRKESARLRDELGVNVIALDLYDGQVATTPDKASEYMQSVKPERALSIIQGALDYVGKDAKVGTIGWCFGGGWSLQSALLLGKQAKACVMFYGMPEKDVSKLKTLNTPVLGIFAAKDKWISPEVVSAFQKDMKKAGKKLKVYSYDADHAFANPSNPKYDKIHAEDAWKKVIAFYKKNL